MTPDLCRRACCGSRYFSVQNGNQCFCGESYGAFGKAYIDGCRTPCSGDEKLFCGGGNRNLVFERSTRA